MIVPVGAMSTVRPEAPVGYERVLPPGGSVLHLVRIKSWYKRGVRSVCRQAWLSKRHDDRERVLLEGGDRWPDCSACFALATKALVKESV